MKTLKTLQTLAKVGKILSTIVYVVCIVGGCLCAAGIISLLVIPEGFRIGGVTIAALIFEKAGWSMTTCYAAAAIGIVFCAGEAVLAKFAERYFKNELAAGTPFTFDGAKELMRLGVLAICISVGTAIVVGIVYGVFRLAAEDMNKLDLYHGGSAGIGVMMIVGSLLCRHGAEVSEKTEEREAA
ncbi:MAG: hypothetical protein II872_05565 [Clostridia bacterium]|nr:hypothetical protein [Clostridia bacterium]